MLPEVMLSMGWRMLVPGSVLCNTIYIERVETDVFVVGNTNVANQCFSVQILLKSDEFLAGETIQPEPVCFNRNSTRNTTILNWMNA